MTTIVSGGSVAGTAVPRSDPGYRGSDFCGACAQHHLASSVGLSRPRFSRVLALCARSMLKRIVCGTLVDSSPRVRRWRLRIRFDAYTLPHWAISQLMTREMAAGPALVDHTCMASHVRSPRATAALGERRSTETWSNSSAGSGGRECFFYKPFKPRCATAAS